MCQTGAAGFSQELYLEVYTSNFEVYTSNFEPYTSKLLYNMMAWYCLRGHDFYYFSARLAFDFFFHVRRPSVCLVPTVQFEYTIVVRTSQTRVCFPAPPFPRTIFVSPGGFLFLFFHAVFASPRGSDEMGRSLTGTQLLVNGRCGHAEHFRDKPREECWSIPHCSVDFHGFVANPCPVSRAFERQTKVVLGAPSCWPSPPRLASPALPRHPTVSVSSACLSVGTLSAFTRIVQKAELFNTLVPGSACIFSAAVRIPSSLLISHPLCLFQINHSKTPGYIFYISTPHCVFVFFFFQYSKSRLLSYIYIPSIASV